MTIIATNEAKFLLGHLIERKSLTFEQCDDIVSGEHSLTREGMRAIIFKLLSAGVITLEDGNKIVLGNIDPDQVINLVSPPKARGRPPMKVIDSQSNILENENRERIMETIRNIPGMTARALADSLNINFGTMKWHVNILIKGGMLRKVEETNKQYFFTSDSNPQRDWMYITINKKTMKEVLECIITVPSPTIDVIANAIGKSSVTIKRKLDALEKKGIIRFDKNHEDIHIVTRLEREIKEFIDKKNAI